MHHAREDEGAGTVVSILCMLRSNPLRYETAQHAMSPALGNSGLKYVLVERPADGGHRFRRTAIHKR